MKNSSERTKSNIHRQQDDWDEVHEQMVEAQQNGMLQKKSLTVSDPGDADEKEADEVARKVSQGEPAAIHEAGGTINRKGVIQRQQHDPPGKTLAAGAKAAGHQILLADVKSVKSKIVPAAEGAASGQWVQVENRYAERNKTLGEINVIKEWRKGNETPLDSLINTKRWDSLAKGINDEKQTGKTFAIPVNEYKTEIADEEKDRDAITGKFTSGTKSVITKFLSALKTYIPLRKKIDSEKKFFHQYDQDFINDDVLKILKATTPSYLFTPGDVKAQTAVESGDFKATVNPTNAAVRGIGQVTSGTKTIGINWAKNKAGVTIQPTVKQTVTENGKQVTKDVDSRDDPKECIKIVAGVLGHYLDYASKYVGSQFPTDNLEKKKFVWAAYNTLPSTFESAVTAAKKVKPTAGLVFTDLTTLPTATKTYIKEIVAR